MEIELINVIWFILIGVLFAGFFSLSGFDFGTGILGYFLTNDTTKRAQYIKAIGPTWETNQVWLITAGGAMFAAFPGWYATFFSAYYLPLVLMIFALILRGLALEYRSKIDNKYIPMNDFLFFLGNFLNAFLWGVVMANSLTGIAINEKMLYTGNMFNLLSPYAIFGGLLSLLFFTAHGATFLLLKGPSETKEKTQNIAKINYLILAILSILFFFYTKSVTNIINELPLLFIILIILLPILSYIFITMKTYKMAFISSFLIPLSVVGTLFTSMFPNVLISSVTSQNNLNIMNTASSSYTLKLMLTITLFALPVILVYKIWVYRVFRKNVDEKVKELY